MRVLLEIKAEHGSRNEAVAWLDMIPTLVNQYLPLQYRVWVAINGWKYGLLLGIGEGQLFKIGMKHFGDIDFTNKEWINHPAIGLDGVGIGRFIEQAINQYSPLVYARVERSPISGEWAVCVYE